MATRADRARRMLGVLNQLKKVEEWRYAELANRVAELTGERDAIVEALGTSHDLSAGLIKAYSQRAGRRIVAAKRAEAARHFQSRRLLSAAARARSGERLSSELDQAESREHEAKDLLDIIERVGAASTRLR